MVSCVTGGNIDIHFENGGSGVEMVRTAFFATHRWPILIFLVSLEHQFGMIRSSPLLIAQKCIQSTNNQVEHHSNIIQQYHVLATDGRATSALASQCCSEGLPTPGDAYLHARNLDLFTHKN